MLAAVAKSAAKKPQQQQQQGSNSGSGASSSSGTTTAGSSSNSDDRIMQRLNQTLNKNEKSLLLASWTKLGGEGGRCAPQVMTRIFERLCDKHGDIEQMFTSVTRARAFTQAQTDNMYALQEHGRRLAELLTNLLLVVNRPRAEQHSAMSVRGIGEMHASDTHITASTCGFAMDASYWERWGTIAAAILANHQVNRNQRLTQLAWTKLMAVLTDQLCAGYEHGKALRRHLAAEKFCRAATTVKTATRWKSFIAKRRTERLNAAAKNEDSAAAANPTSTTTTALPTFTYSTTNTLSKQVAPPTHQPHHPVSPEPEVRRGSDQSGVFVQRSLPFTDVVNQQQQAGYRNVNRVRRQLPKCPDELQQPAPLAMGGSHDTLTSVGLDARRRSPSPVALSQQQQQQQYELHYGQLQRALNGHQSPMGNSSPVRLPAQPQQQHHRSPHLQRRKPPATDRRRMFVSKRSESMPDEHFPPILRQMAAAQPYHPHMDYQALATAGRGHSGSRLSSQHRLDDPGSPSSMGQRSPQQLLSPTNTTSPAHHMAAYGLVLGPGAVYGHSHSGGHLQLDNQVRW